MKQRGKGLVRSRIATSRPVIIACSIALLAIWSLSWLAATQLRALILHNVEDNLRNLNRAIAAQTELALTSANASLKEVREWVEDNPDHDLAIMLSVMKREMVGAPSLRDMLLVDKEGFLVQVASEKMPTTRLNFSDRQWFKDVSTSQSREMTVGTPVMSRVYNTWVVPLAFRIEKNGFKGVLVGSLDPEFFKKFFSDFDLGEGAAITLQREDSTLLARLPHREESMGRTFPGPIYKALTSNAEAITRNRSIIDGLERIQSGRRVQDFPFYVAISITEAEVLKKWRNQTAIIIISAASLSLLIAILGLAHIRLKNQITAREKVEEELLSKVSELARSNADLEQFAYVASHDLREPLRMVSNFLALIERRLGSQMEGEIKEFIGFAVDGAKRMDSLILDLLDYSRIGRGNVIVQKADANKAVADALANLNTLIEECQAEIKIEQNLPAIYARPDEVTRLFQNLIGNSLKYRQADILPLISISGKYEGDMAEFTIHDNGIGIEPAECERIFGIFKRLHTQEKYKGTGIGLAICRKIVANHGGEIKAHSDGPGTGASFIFTLPTMPN